VGVPPAGSYRYHWLPHPILGEQFEEPRVIGLGLSLRTKERLLEIWLKDGRQEKVRANVSNKLRQFLGLDPDSVTLYYKEHQKSIKVILTGSLMQDQSTMKNAEGFKFMKQNPYEKKSYPQQNNYESGKNWSSNSHYEEGYQGGYRKKSGFENGGANGYHRDKPFSHLGANFQSNDDKQRVYRMKAPSYHQ